MIKNIFILAFLFILAGCDLGELGSNSDAKQPVIMLGSGVELQISETETAKVYGYDKCPAHEMQEWIFGPAVETDGCTKLLGNKTVSVVLITGGGRMDEVWTVAEGHGASGTGISISRPNGWSLKEPQG